MAGRGAPDADLVTPFAFATAGRIAFGSGVSGQAPSIAATLGRRAFILTGATPARSAWLVEGLRAAGPDVVTFAVAGEPKVDTVRRSVVAAREFGADVILAIGGGSVIDAGKATAALLREAGDPLDYLEVVGAGRRLSQPPAPLIAIPTTAGTGAEVTMNAVLAAPGHRRKVSLRDPRLLPAHALIDPELLAGTPHGVLLASGLDAIVQVIEPYLSQLASPLTDALCREAIPRGLAALPRLLAGEDARADMAFVSLCGGLALANAGLGAVHGLAGVIGGRTGAPHGAICGRLLPGVLAANTVALAPDHPAQARLGEVRAWIASALGGGAGEAVETLRTWTDRQGLPRLGALGVKAADAETIAIASAASSSMRGNPVVLTPEALAEIVLGA
jgi:alcohol dehydrogenase class IV